MPKFKEILGNEKNIRHFSEARKQGRLSHAYIVCGSSGSGKKTFTENIAAGLLCEEEGVLPCGKCASCIKAQTENHPDIIRVIHEKEGSISVDEIREQVVEDINIKPYYGPHKIYIINDADLMTTSAQNAILKTIEEPPGYGMLFLLTSNFDGLLETIHSRCVKIDMDLLSDEQIENELSGAEGIDVEEMKKVLPFARGNLGKAKELLKGKGISEIKNETSDLMKNLLRMSAFDIFSAVREIKKEKAMQMTDDLYIWFRDVLAYKATKNKNDIYFSGDENGIFKQAKEMEYETLNDIFNDIEKARYQMNANVKPEAAMEALLLQIQYLTERGK